MHAAHIKITEPISIATPASVKASGTPRPSLPDESFGLQWQREMSARATNANRQAKNTAEETVPETDAKGELSSSVRVESKPGATAEEATEPKVEIESTSDTAARSVVATATGVADAPKAEAPLSPLARADQASAPASVPPTTKRAAAKAGFADVPQDAKTAVEAGPVAVAVMTANVQAGVQSGTPAIVAQVAAAEKTAVNAKTMSPGVKRPAAIAETEKATVEKSARAVDEAVVAPVGKEAKATPLSQVGTRSGGEQAATGTIAFGGHSNTEGAPAIQTGLQLSTIGAIGATAQTLAPNHGATLSMAPATPTSATAASEGGALNGHQVLTAAPTQLDVGVFDGTHGWLRIRAELGASGDVSASLTASAATHGALRAAVPEMSNYLAAESVSVSKIAVHRAVDVSIAMGLTPGGSGQNEESQGRQSGQQALSDAGVLRRNSVSVNGTGASAGAAAPIDRMGGVSLPMPWMGAAFGSGGSSGSWLNVRA